MEIRRNKLRIFFFLTVKIIYDILFSCVTKKLLKLTEKQPKKGCFREYNDTIGLG